MQVFTSQTLYELTNKAKANPRLRQHKNIHISYQDPCQRLFNAIEPGSYIRPHKHATDPRDEMLVAVRGLMALVTFKDDGEVIEVVRFGSEKYGAKCAVGVELPSDTWHTVVALVPGCVLLEIKAGPFDPNQPKDSAPWAPEEGSDEDSVYLRHLVDRVNHGAWAVPKLSSPEIESLRHGKRLIADYVQKELPAQLDAKQLDYLLPKIKSIKHK